MDNEVILKYLQTSYDSLKYFNIKNNILYFNDEKIVYTLPLTYINLNMLPVNLFLLKPRDIYRIIYLLELYNKDTLTENDVEFIKQYTNKYLKLETMRLENQDVNENEVICLSIPIYTSYDSKYINKPAVKIIQELLNNHAEEIESSKSHGQKLVLTNQHFSNTYEDEENNFSEISKAGFTTILLIVSTIVLTSIYIALFIIAK